MSGRIWVMDAPLHDTDFPSIRRICQLDQLEKVLQDRGVPFNHCRFALFWLPKLIMGWLLNEILVALGKSEESDFNIGSKSEFVELGSTLKNVFGSDYDRRVTSHFHQVISGNNQRHCYQISMRALEADLVISVSQSSKLQKNRCIS